MTRNKEAIMQMSPRRAFTLIELLVVIAIIAIDMPYGPTFAILPHTNGLNVAYADGHAKWVRVTERDLPGTPGGNWFDQQHQRDGQ